MTTLKEVLENKDDYIFCIDEDDWVCFKKKKDLEGKPFKGYWGKSSYSERSRDFISLILQELGIEERI